MGRLSSRLFLAGMTLVIALTLLAGSTMAWFTLSASPEVSGMQVSLYTGQYLEIADKEDGPFGQSLDLGEAFSQYVELRPVSTTDGIHWFLPAYEPTGELRDASEFLMDDGTSEEGLSHANVLARHEDGTPLPDGELMLAREKGFYVYQDLWLRTDEESCKVRLSVPGKQSNSLDQWELDQGRYGTYALAAYQLDEEKGLTPADAGNQAQTTLRVGFLTEEPEEEAGSRFVIYEPNADQRSDGTVKPVSSSTETDTRYILEYDKTDETYPEGQYIPTRPIEMIIGEDGTKRGKVREMVPDNLIIQRSSSWDMNLVKQALDQGEKPDSNAVQAMGRFFTDNSNGSGESIAGPCLVVTLEKDVPRKVRMFIWLEGQDVDCWNDIAAGTFVLNLELAGETE